jgi:NAD/NADP transhydrogenase alpha subunit
MFATGFGKPISETTIGVPAEIFEGEKRVALSPEAVKRLKKDGFHINIEKGAGTKAGFLDSAFEAEGATIVDNAFKSDIVFKLRPPAESEVAKLEPDTGLVSYLYPKIQE